MAILPLKRMTKYPSVPFLALSVYALVILMKLNGSSFRILENKTTGNLFGNTQGARADEFQRSTPMILGKIIDQNFYNQSLLSQPNLFNPKSLQNLLVYPDKYLFSYLSLDYQFSALWFSGIFLAFIGTYFFTNQFVKNKKITGSQMRHTEKDINFFQVIH